MGGGFWNGFLNNAKSRTWEEDWLLHCLYFYTHE